MDAEPILRAQGLTKHFPVTQGLLWTKVVGWVKAVDGISFSVRRARRWPSWASPAAARRRPPS